MDIDDPALSADGTEIAYVRQGHFPGGDEIEFSIDVTGVSQMASVASLRKRIPAFDEPKVMLCKIDFRDCREIGRGREPSFSKDGRRIVFDQLIGSYEALHRETARVFGGESVTREVMEAVAPSFSLAIHDRGTGTTRVVARPDTGAYYAPFFSDDGEWLYFFSSADWAGLRRYGGTGLERVDVDSGRRETVLGDKYLGRPASIERVVSFEGTLFAQVALPGAPAPWGPRDHYLLVALAQPPRLIHTWGNAADERILTPPVFQILSNGTVLVYDRGWTVLRADGTLVSRGDGTLELERGAAMSPDGRYVAGTRFKGDDYHLVVIEIGHGNGAEVADLGNLMEVHGIRWSSDSRRFVVSGMRPDHRNQIVLVGSTSRRAAPSFRRGTRRPGRREESSRRDASVVGGTMVSPETAPPQRGEAPTP